MSIRPMGPSQAGLAGAFAALGSMGQQRRELTPPAGPLVVNAAAATVTLGGPYTTDVGNSLISGGVKRQWSVLQPGTYWQFLGGTPAASGNGNSDNIADVGAKNPYVLEMWVPGSQVEFWIAKNNISSGGAVRVIVDDQYVSATPIFLTGTNKTSGYTYERLNINLGSSTGPRKVRLELLQCAIISMWHEANLPPWPTTTKATKVAFLTDSYGIVSDTQKSLLTWPYHVARLMRWDHPVLFAEGGTGYLNVGTGAETTFRSRLTQVAALAPEQLVVLGGYNDPNAPGYTTAALTAEVTAFVNAVRTTCPTVKRLFIVGAQQPQQDSAQAAANTAIAAGVAAASPGIPVTFIDQTGWITGGNPTANTAPVKPPTNRSTLDLATSGGTYAAGTYYAVVTGLTAYGETTPSNEVAATVAANGTITWEWSWSFPVASWTLWIGPAGGPYTRKVTGLTSPFYVDTGAGGSTGSFTPPASNTSGTSGSAGNSSLYVLPDRTHMTAEGHAYVATRVAEAIRAALPA